jgi:hypothetical protein
LLSPFLLLALPAIALTAVSALCFEMLPFLRGGFGNVAWFFVWDFGIAAPVLSGRRWLDPTGLVSVMNSLGAEASRYVPGYHGGMSFTIDIGQHVQVVQAWRWPGIAWDAPSVLLRLMWFGVASAIVPLAALVFDRFDSSRSRKTKNRGGKTIPASTSPSPVAVNASNGAAPVHLTPLAVTARANTLARIFSAELRLALFGLRWWWYVIAIGFLIAQLAAPLRVSRGPILASAWMWSVFVWSGMGARESRFGTRSLLFSCAKILPRQLVACFLAGLTVAILTGAGAGVRLLLTRSFTGLFAWSAGALFLPALALALGTLSGTGKPFEGLLTAIWYVGPMNHTPGLDFTGTASGPHTVSYALTYLAITAALLVSAYAIRFRQLSSI